MSVIARHMKKQRRQRLSGDWQPSRSVDRAEENLLFDASFELAEAAQTFDQTAGIQKTSPVTAAVLGCTTSALHAQANAVQRMRSLIRHELAPSDRCSTAAADIEELHQLLGRIEEHLRFTAAEADRARRLASAVLTRRAAAPERLPAPEPEAEGDTYEPVSTGTPTKLPHSVHEPS